MKQLPRPTLSCQLEMLSSRKILNTELSIYPHIWPLSSFLRCLGLQMIAFSQLRLLSRDNISFVKSYMKCFIYFELRI